MLIDLNLSIQRMHVGAVYVVCLMPLLWSLKHILHYKSKEKVCGMKPSSSLIPSGFPFKIRHREYICDILGINIFFHIRPFSPHIFCVLISKHSKDFSQLLLINDYVFSPNCNFDHTINHFTMDEELNNFSDTNSPAL